MDSQQSYKGSRKIIDSIIERINKRIHKGTNKSLEEEISKIIEPSISQIDYMLKKLNENIKEKANLPVIERSDTSMGLYLNKDINEPMKSGYYYLTKNIYSRDNLIECNLNKITHKIKCTKYKDMSSFDLFDPLQSSYFVEGIKNPVLSIFNTVYPKVLTNMDNPYINIIAYISTYPDKPIKNNPEIITGGNVFRYDNGKSNVMITWGPYAPSKLYYF
jgi:hypothetical protein